jgi:hypothetical protein
MSAAVSKADLIFRETHLNAVYVWVLDCVVGDAEGLALQRVHLDASGEVPGKVQLDGKHEQQGHTQYFHHLILLENRSFYRLNITENSLIDLF